MSGAYVYCRYSSNLQDESSIERQLQLAIEWCQRSNVQLNGQFIDRATSGYKTALTERDGLQDFLTSPEVMAGDYLLIEKLDRLTRTDVQTTLPLIWQIESKGVKIVTTMDGRELSSSDIGSLIMTLVEADKGNAYVRDLSARSKKAKKIKMEKQIYHGGEKTASAIPDWIYLSEDKMSYLIREERAALIRRVFDMAIDMGNGSIAQILNNEGIPCWKKTKYGRWTGSMIKTICANYRVHGEKRTRQFGVIPDFFPPIISKEKFLIVRDAMNKRVFDPNSKFRPAGGKKTKLSNLFSGIARCSNCGHTLHYKYTGDKVRVEKNGKEYSGYRLTRSYLICADRCTKTHGNYKVFEYALVEFSKVIDWSQFTTVKSDTEKYKGALLINQELISEVSQKIANLTEAVASTGNLSLISALEQNEEKLNELHKDSEDLKLKLAAELAIEKRLEDEDVGAVARRIKDGDMETRIKFNSALKNRVDWLKIQLDNKPRPHIAIKIGDRIEYIFPHDEKSYHYGWDALNGFEVDFNGEE